jgi:hypothetical protein
VTAVSFTTSQTFSGITADEFKSNATARVALAAVIAKTATLEGSAGTPNVTITGVVDVARRSRSRSLLSVTGSGTKVTYTVVYTYDSAATVAADTIRSNFISQLTLAINDGSLLTSLHFAVSSVFTSSITTSATDLSVSDVTVVVIERPLPTQSPTTAPKIEEEDPMSKPFIIGGIVAGSIVLIFALGFCLGQGFSLSANGIKKKQDLGNNKVRIMPVNSEDDFETPRKPNHGSSKESQKKKKFFDVSALSPAPQQPATDQSYDDGGVIGFTEIKSNNSSFRENDRWAYKNKNHNRRDGKIQPRNDSHDEDDEDQPDFADIPNHVVRELVRPGHMRVENL